MTSRVDCIGLSNLKVNKTGSQLAPENSGVNLVTATMAFTHSIINKS